MGFANRALAPLGFLCLQHWGNEREALDVVPEEGEDEGAQQY